MDDLDGLKLANGVVVAPNDCCHDNGCHMSDVTRDMDGGGSSVGEEEDTTGRKMSAVGKRHSKCPRRLGEEEIDAVGDVNKSKNKKKSTRTSVKENTSAKDVAMVTDEKENGENKSVDSTKKKGQAVTRKRKSNEQSARNENDAGDTPENPVVVVEELSSQNESVDNTKKKGQAVTRKRKSNEQSARNENDAGDTLENPVVVVEELSSIKPKRQRKAKPGSKGSEANSAEPCEPQLKGTKKRVKPKKQQGGMIVVEENATDGLAKVDPLDGVPAEGKDAPHGDTDSKDKTKVAAKSKAKKKKPPKNDGKLEKNSTNETQSITKVNKATDVVGRQPAKQKSRRKKAPAEESSKNPLSGSTSDIVSDLSRKDVSPAKKKKLDKCAKDNKSVVDTDSVSATNNTQDDVKVALDIKDASGVTDTSVVPCSDTEATGKALTNTNTTERSDQELKEQNSATCNNSSTRSSISPLETQSDRTESEPKAKESELKATASNEEDASRCFPCSHCKYRAKRKVQLRKHLGTHGVHQCAHCEFVCESSATLTEHMQSVHPDKYGRKKCKRCLRIIKMGDIEEHELACTGELRPWSCTQCGKEFKYECQLNLHARAHMSEDAAATAVKTHPCPHCDYSAYVKANLAKHLKTVHGTDRQKTVKCPECEKLFYTPSHMRKHLKLHSDEMPFACNVCAKAFRTARCLKRHTFVHMDSPAFICNIDGCKKAFEKHVLLKSHKLDCHQVADGASSSPPVKQFKCSYPDCEQAFYKKSHLARHEVIHTGERKFVCDWKDCGKAFRHSDNLRVHYRRHTNEKPIKCDKCDFTCRQKSSLQFHMKSRHELAGSAGTSPETKVGKDASPKKQNGDGAATDGESELKSDTPEMLVGASVTTGLAGGGIIRAAEMAPLAKTEAQPTPTKVSHDVYDFHDSDDDDDMNHSIGLQMRQKTVGKSPPCGSLLNNSSFVSIRDEAQHRYVTNVAASDEKVALAKDTDIETAVKPNTAGKATKKTQARPTPDGDKSSIVQNDTPQTKAPSRKRKKKEASSVEKKCEDVGSENPAAEKAVVTAVTSPVTITTPRGLPTATTMKTTKKKAATKRSRKKKPPIEEETTTEQASDAVEQPSMPENTNDSLKEVSQDVDDGHTTTDDGLTTTNDGHTTTDDGHTTTDVDNVDTRTCDAGAVHVRVEDPSGDVVAQQVCPPDAVNEWPSSESRTTVTNDSTGQLYEHEYRPEDPQQEQNIDPIDEQTEDMTEEEANELLPSPATVSQLMSEKDVNELSMPSMANGSPNLSVHSDFVNNVAMSPRTYNESPQFSGKCDEYEQEKELEAATAEAESAMFGVEMPAITSQDQTKINDILDSQAELMPPSSENMIDTADNHSPFMMPGSTGNAYNNTTDSRDTYSSSVANLSYPVDAMSADKKADENADISQCYSGANASYGGYPSLSSVQERQSVLKSNPAASVSCNYSPPPPPPQPSYQPLPSHSLYGGRSASVLPPVGSYSHVPNPSFLLDPNLLTNGGSTKGLESLRNSEPAYVISRDGPQLPVSSASSASNKALPISSCFPGSEGYASSTKDFFGQYFQDPTTMPLTHLPTSADQRLYHRAPHRAGFDFLPRVPGTASVLPGATTYPASVSESLAAAMNPAMNPQHAQSHWGVAHDDRSHPWAQPSPMLMAPDLNAARNPFSASSTADRSTDLNFDPSAASRQLTKRAVPESTFPIPQPNTVGADPYSSMTNAYIGRAFNPAAAVAPSNYMMNMSSSMSSTQKQLEEAYRQSAVAAAAHIADYRSLAPQAAVPDIYSRMGVNPTLGLDKYYYSRREQMYRSQAIAATPNPFLAPPPSQTNSTPVSYASDYSCAQVMYAAAAQHSAAAYGFMGDKQYLMSSRKISEAVPMLPERPPDYFPARPSTTEAQDPYRHSVIYNMMSRYY